MNSIQTAPIPEGFKRNKKNTKNVIFIARKSFGAFKRNQFHSSLTDNRVSDEEFLEIIQTVERKVSSFYHVIVFYYFMFISILYCLMFFIFCLFIYPSKDDKKFQSELKRAKLFVFLGAALAIFGIGLSLWFIIVWMKKYENKISKILNKFNEESFAKGKVWRVGDYCAHIQLILLPKNNISILNEKEYNKLTDDKA